MYDPKVIEDIKKRAGDPGTAGAALFEVSDRVRLKKGEAEHAQAWRHETHLALDARCQEHGIKLVDLLKGHRTMALSDDERMYKQGWQQSHS